jgi:hypothetical protein
VGAVSSRLQSARLVASALLFAACGGGGRSGSNISPSAVLAGACIVNGLAASSLSNCGDLNGYSTCAMTMCDLQACLDACKDYESCIQSASDPCTNDCMQSVGCQSCLAPVAACSTNSCLGTLSCGTVTDGGPCDKLERCCENADAAPMSCELAVRVARIGGDPSCQADLATLTSNDSGFALFSCTP